MKVLDAPLELVKGELTAPGSVTGTGSVFAINHNADPSLATLRYRFKDAQFDVAEEPFEAAGTEVQPRVVHHPRRRQRRGPRQGASPSSGLKAHGARRGADGEDAPGARPRASRCIHTWINTQDEGWWRLALDQLAVPYDYISTQDVAKDANLVSKYDVHSLSAGRPRRRAADHHRHADVAAIPLPWKTTELTPNIGKIDSTDDMRPGIGWQGLANLAEVRPRRRRAHRRRRHGELRDSVRA